MRFPYYSTAVGLLTSLALLQPTYALPEITASGLNITHITPPITCKHPSEIGDVIHVHYNGTLTDGTPFDSSYTRNQPFTFTVGIGQVIRGWDEGLLGMCIGEERLLVIPSVLAYGSRAIGPIPANSVLVFGTKLLGNDNAPPEDQNPLLPPPSPTATVPASTSTSTSSSTSTSTASSTTSIATTTTTPSTPTAAPTSTKAPDAGPEPGECRLLGPFALFVQAGLGVLAILSLVFKRWREVPRRPVKVWAFDASKQVLGSALLHVLNLIMSMLSSSSIDIEINAPDVLELSAQLAAADAEGRMPNPCSFYLINIAVDTTIGIPILIVLLRLLHHAFSLTPLANPPESLRSGNYGQPPRTTWWLKQSLIYFIGLVLMKACVFFIFQLLPWIAWVGDWALRWTEGSEALQIAFVMFVFPVIMNALQYYIVDSFIKDRPGEGEEGFERVATHDDGEDGGEEGYGYPERGSVDDDEAVVKKSSVKTMERREEEAEEEEEGARNVQSSGSSTSR